MKIEQFHYSDWPDHGSPDKNSV